MDKIGSLESVENGLEDQPLLSKKKLKSTEKSTTCTGIEKEETKASFFAMCMKIFIMKS